MKKVRTKLELGQKIKGLDLSKPFILLHRGDWTRTSGLHVPNVAL